MFGVIGDPVSHSLSPLLQNRFLDQHGIDAVYVPFHVARSDVSKALEGLWATGVEGFNVTVPHKEAVLKMVEADTDTRCIGAVNTVRRGPDGRQGTNTDWQGFREVLRGMGIDLSGATVFVFGAGGTARAVLHALAQEAVAKVNVCNRGSDRLHALIRHASRVYPQLPVGAVPWDQEAVNEASGEAMLVVNTTSIGLGGDSGPFPFKLSGRGAAIDAVYALNGATAFVRCAGQTGRKAIDGLPMLLAQGAASFQYWHRILPPRMDTLRWLEARLGRTPVDLPAWGVAI